MLINQLFKKSFKGFMAATVAVVLTGCVGMQERQDRLAGNYRCNFTVWTQDGAQVALHAERMQFSRGRGGEPDSFGFVVAEGQDPIERFRWDIDVIWESGNVIGFNLINNPSFRGQVLQGTQQIEHPVTDLNGNVTEVKIFDGAYFYQSNTIKILYRFVNDNEEKVQQMLCEL